MPKRRSGPQLEPGVLKRLLHPFEQRLESGYEQRGRRAVATREIPSLVEVGGRHSRGEPREHLVEPLEGHRLPLATPPSQHDHVVARPKLADAMLEQGSASRAGGAVNVDRYRGTGSSRKNGGPDGADLQVSAHQPDHSGSSAAAGRRPTDEPCNGVRVTARRGIWVKQRNA